MFETKLDKIIEEKINEDVFRAWATPSEHVKSVVSLPSDVFNELVQKLDELRSCFDEDDPSHSGYAYSIPQDVFFGHMLLYGVNELLAKHPRPAEAKSDEGDGIKIAALNIMAVECARREEKIKNDAKDTPVEIDAEDRQAAAIVQYLKKSFGPDVKIARTKGGYDIIAPTGWGNGDKELVIGKIEIVESKDEEMP